tara:strand:+ start:518 stop:1081 length:564 start_codon:yes stop_codon:yes gene_type:complete
MVSRSDTSKTIRRRRGGYAKKTGKGTTVKKINIDRHRWEDDPDFKGTPGPYNPRSKKMKKKKYDYEVYQDLGPMGPIGTVSYDADWPVAKRKHIEEGRLAKGSLTALEKKILADRDRRKPRTPTISEEEKARNKKRREEILGNPQTGAAALQDQGPKKKRKGGTVKKRKGGKVKLSSGSKFVASLYE